MPVEHQQALEDAQLVQYAADIGLDTGRFNQDLGQHIYLHRIKEDLECGAHSGVHGTPTLFVNSVRYEGLLSTAELYRVLLSELGGLARYRAKNVTEIRVFRKSVGVWIGSSGCAEAETIE